MTDANESFAQMQPLVLLVDDDPVFLTLGQEILGAAGFRIVTADTAVKAMQSFHEYRPDVVILDVQIPPGDGLAVCREIRGSSRPDVPVIMATANDDLPDIVGAYEAGATDFISKPVNWGMLPYRLRYVLRGGHVVQDLVSRQQRLRAVLDAIPDQLLLLDSRGVVIEDIRQVLGATPVVNAMSMAGSALEDLMPAEAAQVMREQMHTVARTGQPAAVEYHVGSLDQVHETRLVPQAGDQMLAIIRDVTARHRAEQRVRQLADYDPVTRLPNRALFTRELRRALRGSRRTGKQVALLYIDLDRFKRINDTLGHSVGDALLKGVGERLSGTFRSQDRLAPAATHPVAAHIGRLGGDEFVALMPDIDLKEQASSVASRIRQLLVEPFVYEGRQFVVTASIGIAVYPDDGADAESLMAHADLAMYQAKQAGGNAFRQYHADMNVASLDRLELENDLRLAIERGGLELHLQPKHALRDSRITGAEALLRWKHPQRGWISPAEFIPIAEETGLIVDLGEWVTEESCRMISRWSSGPLAALTLSLNLSVGQVMHSDVPKTVLDAIRRHGIDPTRLELEITESLLMQNLSEARKMLESLKQAGLKIALDDFGTGHSSLAYLRQLPLDALKIDRSFVQQSHECADDAAICGAIIAMGKKLGLKTIAEGIELEEQYDFLARAGCDEGQGFLFGKAMPLSTFEAYAREAFAGLEANIDPTVKMVALRA